MKTKRQKYKQRTLANGGSSLACGHACAAQEGDNLRVPRKPRPIAPAFKDAENPAITRVYWVKCQDCGHAWKRVELANP